MPKQRDVGTQLTQVRKLVQDVETEEYYKTDGFLLRWLEYSNYNEEKAAIAFRQSRKWRCQNKIDSILDEDFSDLAVRFPVSLNQFDKYGRLIINVSFESFDSLKRFDFTGEEKRYIRFAYWNQEKLEKSIKEQFNKTGGTISQSVAVIDCTKMSDHIKNIGLRRLYAALFLVKELVANLENNFPRGVCATYVINAPKVFVIFYSAIKQLFCKETVNSFQVHGVDSKFDWKAELL